MSQSRLDRYLLAAAAAAYLALCAAFWPPMYLASDEAGNLALAGVLGRGTVFADVAGSQLPEAIPVSGGHQASRYPPGLAALLVPFVRLYPAAAFALPLAFHLAGFFILTWLMKRAGRSPLWALLWLFYPTAILHSRVLMSNLPEAVLLLGALALLVRGGWLAALAAGLLIGAGLVVRPTLAVGAAALFAGALWRDRSAILAAPSPFLGLLGSRAAALAAGALPGLGLLLGYNWHVFGSPVDSGYRQVGGLGFFSAAALLTMLPRYLIFLALIYPLMLVAPAVYRGKWKLEIFLVPLFYLAFYGAYHWPESGAGLSETLLRQSRFVLPAVPFLLIAYSGVVSARLRLWPGAERAALVLFMAAGLAGSGWLMSRHYRAQAREAAVRDALYSLTAEGSLVVGSVEVSKLVQDFRGRRRIMDIGDLDLGALTAEAAAGKAVFLVTLSKPAPTALSVWEAKVKEQLAARFDLDGGERVVGDWKLGVWKLKLRSGEAVSAENGLRP